MFHRLTDYINLNAIYTDSIYSYTEILVHACLRAAHLTETRFRSDTGFKDVTVNRSDALSTLKQSLSQTSASTNGTIHISQNHLRS